MKIEIEEGETVLECELVNRNIFKPNNHILLNEREENTDYDFEAYKIQFFVIGDLELKDSIKVKGVIVAFYISGNNFNTYIVDGLPETFTQKVHKKFLVDYDDYEEVKNYIEVNRQKLSDYIHQIKNNQFPKNILKT